jgi:hypothetical protein
LADIKEGEGELLKMDQGTYWGRFNANLETEAKVRINILNFPGWRVFVD